MGDQTDLLTASIDDYLISLGDSLHKAQRQLSHMATELQPGESSITYHVPRLEFELKVSFELSRSRDAAGDLSGKQLLVRPVSGAASANTENAQAASIIRGTFVAVPVSGGKPPPVMKSTLTQRSNRMLQVDVEVRSAAGERLGGIDVQFNVDVAQSRSLTEAHAGTFVLAPGTGFVTGRARTDADGRASNLLQVGEAQPAGVFLLLTLDISGATERILYPIP